MKKTIVNRRNQKGDEIMSSHLHCRIEPKQKAKFIRQAQKEGMKLCVWMLKTLDANS